MSPAPLIELQRRLAVVGAVRMGGEKQPKAPGRKLSTWRLTSPRRDLIEQAAQLYGGSVSQWEGPNGPEWQAYTEQDEIPVLVLPAALSHRVMYELWEGTTKRLRVCDGFTEELSGHDCLCNAEGVDRCSIYSRLVVTLPELDTVLGWRLISKGANAAHELPASLAVIDNVRAAGQLFVPARLRIDQRRGVKDGQVVRYVVPALDLSVGYLAIASGPSADRDGDPQTALNGGSGQHPSTALVAAATATRGPTLGDALGSFAQRSAASTPRRIAPMAEVVEGERERNAHTEAVELPPQRGEYVPPWETEPTPAPSFEGPKQEERPPAAPQEPDAGAADAGARESYHEQRESQSLTEAQKRKANVLVGKLRTPGHISTQQLWAFVAKQRRIDVDHMIALLEGVDEQGALHWAPLRDSLTRAEASELIDALTVKEGKVDAADAASRAQASDPGAAS